VPCSNENEPEVLLYACLRLRFAGGALVAWEFERDGETVEVEPTGPLVATLGNAADVLVAAAIAGKGILYLFEDWLQPHLESGELEPLLERWWLRFSGPFSTTRAAVTCPRPSPEMNAGRLDTRT